MKRLHYIQVAVLGAISLATVAFLLAHLPFPSEQVIVPEIKGKDVKTVIYIVDKEAYEVARKLEAIQPLDTIDTLPWKN